MTQEFVTLPREVVDQAVEALFCTDSEEGSTAHENELKAVKKLRAAMEQWGREPAAEHELKDVRCECCGYMTHQREHMGCIRAVQPVRKPLSYEKIRKAWNDAEGCRYGYEDFARAIERAHGIEGEA